MKNNQADADLLHSYALRPKPKEFWVEIFSFDSSVFRVQLTSDPLLVKVAASEKVTVQVS